LPDEWDFIALKKTDVHSGDANSINLGDSHFALFKLTFALQK
jgi:hypothetical protein